MKKRFMRRMLAPILVLALVLAQQTVALACSGMELTSAEGDAYWFRTCDMNDIYNVFGENGSYISASYLVAYPAKQAIPFATGSVNAKYTVIGTSFSDSYAVLDGMNNKGLTGGLLMFNEGTSYPEETAPEGKTMVAGMEVVTYILSQCASVEEVIALTDNIVVKAIEVPGIPGSGLSATMHLTFTDKSGRMIVLEASDAEKPGVYTWYESNGVMTNSPEYFKHLKNLEDYKATMKDASEVGTIGDDPANRFIRLSLQREKIEGGTKIKNNDMLAVGSQQMTRVVRPLYDGNISYTMYMVAYDIARSTMYFKPYDSNTWTSLKIGDVDKTARTTYSFVRGLSNDGINNVGAVLKDSKAGCKYLVTNKNEVQYFASTKKDATAITVPASVTISGTTYKVTSIADNALKGNTKIKSVSIGANVKSIGKDAFNGCKNLKTVTIKTKKLTATSVGAEAFKGINSSAKIKVPASKLNDYTALLKDKGVTGKKQTIQK